MIFAEKTEDSLDVNHQDEHKVVRILSVREGGKTKGNMLKINKVYFFNLVSLYWKTTELGINDIKLRTSTINVRENH